MIQQGQRICGLGMAEATAGVQIPATPIASVATRRSTRFEHVYIGGQTTGETPKNKAKRQRVLGNPCPPDLTASEQEVRSRKKDCLGFPVFTANPDLATDEDADPISHSRHHCVVCGKLTAWFCIGCHEYVCADVREGKRNTGYYVVHLGGQGGKQILCKKTCCIKSHLPAQTRYANDE